MKMNNWVIKGFMTAAAALAITGPAGAAQQEWAEIDAEIRACVATVAENANYSDATRVRHAVTNVKERVVGYRLTIETSLYNETSDAAIRAYASSCVVNGSNAPLQFSIKDAGNDA
jgi:hypothetical protein